MYIFRFHCFILCLRLKNAFASRLIKNICMTYEHMNKQSVPFCWKCWKLSTFFTILTHSASFAKIQFNDYTKVTTFSNKNLIGDSMKIHINDNIFFNVDACYNRWYFKSPSTRREILHYYDHYLVESEQCFY